jgi:hypothetical protein
MPVCGVPVRGVPICDMQSRLRANRDYRSHHRTPSPEPHAADALRKVLTTHAMPIATRPVDALDARNSQRLWHGVPLQEGGITVTLQLGSTLWWTWRHTRTGSHTLFWSLPAFLDLPEGLGACLASHVLPVAHLGVALLHVTRRLSARLGLTHARPCTGGQSGFLDLPRLAGTG